MNSEKLYNSKKTPKSITMKNLQKVTRENLKSIKGGGLVSDGMGGWYCSNRFEVICLVGCTATCMTGNKCKPSDCIDPVFPQN